MSDLLADVLPLLQLALLHFAGTRAKAGERDEPRFWGAVSTSLLVELQPLCYQTLCFRVLLLLCCACLIWLAYLARLRFLLQRANERLFKCILERERVARDRHDSFSQAIQGLLLRVNTATSSLPADEPSKSVFQQILAESDKVMRDGVELFVEPCERAPDHSCGSEGLPLGGRKEP